MKITFQIFYSMQNLNWKTSKNNEIILEKEHIRENKQKLNLNSKDVVIDEELKDENDNEYNELNTLNYKNIFFNLQLINIQFYLPHSIIPMLEFRNI